MCEYLGRFDQATYFRSLAIESSLSEAEANHDRFLLGWEYEQCGQFALAQREYNALRISRQTAASTVINICEQLAFCCVLTGDAQMMDNVIADVRIRNEDAAPYFMRFKWAMLGYPITETELSSEVNAPAIKAMHTANHLHDLLTLSACANNEGNYAVAVRNRLKVAPMDRMAAIQWDDYLHIGKMHPGLVGEGDDFYDFLDWLWPHDPWARDAVKRWKDKGGKPRELTLEGAMETVLHRPKFDPFGQPWHVATCVRGALRDGRTEDARKILDAYIKTATREQYTHAVQAFVSVLRRHIEEGK
jgi:hypothetical protein